MLADAKETASDIAEEDPRLLKQVIKKMEQGLAKQAADTKQYFTGEQPRLEAKVQETVDAIKAGMDDLMKHVRSLTVPPPPAKTGPSISNHDL
jgi:ubiquinone biosynthesis protein UbiJ